MIREETVFGPIHSRRLGSSLGINLLPRKGKICNFDCIYCECGWNKDGRDDQVLPTAAEVRAALEDKLAACMLEGTPIDSITFSGDGEPTLNPEFPRIIDDTLKLRDAYYPGAKVSVLSNATRVHVPEVAAALKLPDVVLRNEIDELLDLNILSRVEMANRRTGLLPKVPPNKFHILEFIRRINGSGDPETPDFARFDALFARIEKALAESECNVNIHQI